jgi:hypothetical protein
VPTQLSGRPGLRSISSNRIAFTEVVRQCGILPRLAAAGDIWLYATPILHASDAESSPGSVAAERGYYDYSEASEPDATADQAFAEFETSFPPLIRELVANAFSGWMKHCDFLVRYSQMLRARSDLFRQEVLKQASAASKANPGSTGGNPNSDQVFTLRHAKQS